jgi:hypothetical protein
MAQRKHLRDPNQLAKMIVDIASGEISDAETAKILRARKGGAAGGTARARTLTEEQRS